MPDDASQDFPQTAKNPSTNGVRSKMKNDVANILPEVKAVAQEQSLKQFTILGYHPRDRVYLRFMVPKSCPIELAEQLGLTYTDKKTGSVHPSTIDGYLTLPSSPNQKATFTRVWGKSGKTTLFKDGFKQLQEWNKQGYGVYVVVNPGGRSDSEIKCSRALFYEDDKRSKEDQKQSLAQLEAELGGKASLVVETRKSLHVYFVLNQPLDVDTWKKSQQRLILRQDSDPSIFNTARLMRLAGFKHQAICPEVLNHWEALKAGVEGYTDIPEEQLLQGIFESTDVRIIQESGETFDIGTFDRVLPDWAETEWGKKEVQREALAAPVVNRPTTTVVSLSDNLPGVLDEAYQRLRPLQIYNDPCHNWQEANGGNKYRGCCPWHKSESGTSFHIEPKDGVWLWHCASCNIGGNPVEYRYRLRGGNVVPTGKDFVEVVKELAEDAGVEMPEFKQESDQPIDLDHLQAAIDVIREVSDPVSGKADIAVIKSQSELLGIEDWRLKRVIKALNTAKRSRKEVQIDAVWTHSGKSKDDFDSYVESLKKKGGNSADSSGSEPEYVPKIVRDYHRVKRSIGDRLRFNTLKNRIELDGKPFSLDGVKLALAIEYEVAMESGREDCADVVIRIARENQYSPVVEYLNSAYAKHGDSTDVLTGFSKRYFGIDHPIYDRFISRFLISAVARAFEPGCKVDTVLILQGPQGYQKSSFFRWLAGQDWFDDSFGKSSDKDERLKLHNSWLIEWAELERVLKRKESGEVKAFITSQVDHLRRPYGRDVEALPRSCVLVGTSNEDAFLADATGNRRYWVLPVKKRIDVKLLQEERDRIWAAAVALYKRGEQWWLTEQEEKAAEAIAERYSVSDPWQYPIEDFCERKEWVSTRDILDHLQLDLDRQTKADEMRVADILKHMKWRNTLKTIQGKRQKVWVPPTNWSDTTSEPPEPPDTTSDDEVVHPETPTQQDFQYPDTTCNHLSLEKSKNNKNETAGTRAPQPGDVSPLSRFVFPEKPFYLTNVEVSGGITSQNSHPVSDSACTASEPPQNTGGGITSQNSHPVSDSACTASEPPQTPGGGITYTWVPQEGDRVEALNLSGHWAPGRVDSITPVRLRVEHDNGRSMLVFPVKGVYSTASIRPLTEAERT